MRAFLTSGNEDGGEEADHQHKYNTDEHVLRVG